MPDLVLVSRIAEPRDRPLIARLCRRAGGRGDYVLRILKEIIADGGLYLAWSESELVGMTNFELCMDGSGWLSMARTDPAWQRRGVALFLQQQIASDARRKRIRVLRLWTHSRNRRSIRVCLRGGFKQVCEATHISCPLPPRKLERKPRPARPLSKKEMVPLLKSEYLAKMNGYFARKWHFMKASPGLFWSLARRQELYFQDESSFILTSPEIDFGEYSCSAAILGGSPKPTLRAVRETARICGAARLGCFVPYDPHIIRSARLVGYRVDPWATHCLVFEKKL